MQFLCRQHQQQIMASQVSASAYLFSAFNQGYQALAQQDIAAALQHYGAGFDVAIAMMCQPNCRAYHHNLVENALTACQQVCYSLSLLEKWEQAEICAGRLHMRLLDSMMDESIEQEFRWQCYHNIDNSLGQLATFLDIGGKQQHLQSITRFTKMAKAKMQQRMMH